MRRGKKVKTYRSSIFLYINMSNMYSIIILNSVFECPICHNSFDKFKLKTGVVCNLFKTSSLIVFSSRDNL